jgi:hypothetical protein
MYNKLFITILLLITHQQINASYYVSSEEENSILGLNENLIQPVAGGGGGDTVPSVLASIDPNQEFWESLHQNSMFNTRKTYNVPNNEKVCFTCPIDREIFKNLYDAAAGSTHAVYGGQKVVPAPPRVSIAWATELPENRLIFFCRNNTKITTSPIHLSSDYDINGGGDKSLGDSQLDYTCENNRLCLLNAKNNYPHMYKCYVKSHVLNVKLNVIGKLEFFFNFSCFVSFRPS